MRIRNNEDCERYATLLWKGFKIPTTIGVLSYPNKDNSYSFQLKRNNGTIFYINDELAKMIMWDYRKYINHCKESPYTIENGVKIYLKE